VTAGAGLGEPPHRDLDLPLIWAGLIAFAVLAYVVRDGFDLGFGVQIGTRPNGHRQIGCG
jgi:cytochrome bd-type quinol oxidase subunit 2